MLEFAHLFSFRVDVAEPQIAKDGPYGDRRYIPILGGEFSGNRLSGEILTGGADCQLIRPDGVAEIDVRCTFRTNDGAVFLMKGLGMRHGPQSVLDRISAGKDVDPNEYYFRESMTFEAPAGQYEWLNKLVAVGTGQRKAAEVLIDAYEIL